MRIFSGSRNTPKNKMSASALFKASMNKKDAPPMSNDEKYKKMLEARIAKLTQDAMEGKKGGFKLPGTKQDGEPKGMSDNAKKAFAMLAEKKMIKDGKIQKKKEAEWNKSQKKIKNALEAKKAADAAAIAPSSGSFFGGGSSDSKPDGWGW